MKRVTKFFPHFSIRVRVNNSTDTYPLILSMGKNVVNYRGQTSDQISIGNRRIQYSVIGVQAYRKPRLRSLSYRLPQPLVFCFNVSDLAHMDVAVTLPTNIA